jgi:hypothetical protein
MSLRTVLPTSTPDITTFPAYASSLSILQSHPEALDWVYSHYIRIFVTKIEIADINAEYYPTAGYAPGFFTDYDTRRLGNTLADGIFFNRESCPYLNVFEIPYSLIRPMSFVDFVKKCLDSNLYVYAHIDTSKVENYECDGIPSEASDHPIFIYGYDDNNRTFNIADFFGGNKYSFEECKFKNIEDAFESSRITFLPMVKSIAAIQYNDKGVYTLDYEYIRNSVREYILADREAAINFSNYSSTFFKPLNWTVKALLGIDVYRFLSEFWKLYISLSALGVTEIDMRPFHAFYDHKVIMLKRMEYLQKKGVIVNKEKYIAEYCGIRDNLQIARNLVLKYNATKQSNTLLSLDNVLEATKHREIMLLKKIYDI